MAALISGLNLAAAFLLFILGAAACLTSSNAIKRVMALFAAMTGAMLAVTALHASNGLIVAGIAVSVAQTLVGIGVAVRLQEGYGSVESNEIDAADGEDEPVEQRR